MATMGVCRGLAAINGRTGPAWLLSPTKLVAGRNPTTANRRVLSVQLCQTAQRPDPRLNALIQAGSLAIPRRCTFAPPMALRRLRHRTKATTTSNHGYMLGAGVGRERRHRATTTAPGYGSIGNRGAGELRKGCSVSEITELIGRARAGEKAASERIFALLYDELRRLAAAQLRGDAVMRTTSLVHEAYLKLARHGALAVNDRGHFFAVAARAMRQIVIDHVRSRAAVRHGGDIDFASLDSTAMQAAAQDRNEEVLALDAALARLDEVDTQLASLVEMRFYAGLELTEIADVLERSERSLKRDWRRARAFLQLEMTAA